MIKIAIPKNVDYDAMFFWLRDKFGPSGSRWKTIELNYIGFQDSKDALLYSLRFPV